MPYWVSALAEACADCAERGDWWAMQELVKRAAAEHGRTGMEIAKMVAQESDRLGIVGGSMRAMILG